MYIREEIIDEIREKNDIVDVVSGYIKLTRHGANYFGLCPFHTEKSPSFSVSQSKQMFKCFGCGKGGNVFSFVSEYENITFPEAVKLLGEKVGVTIATEDQGEDKKKEYSLRARLIALNKEAATYYFKALRDENVGKTGMDYFIKRGLSKEIMQKFGLGYAPVKSGLIKRLRDLGYTDEEMIASGIAVHNEKYGMSEKFWNRVIFPIMDARNRVLGFGGRVMGDGKPKYLNSPETVIFEKRKNLYGLNIARNAHKDHLIVCEGYMDVIAMHQAGFDQAVASLGTALTIEHVRLISRMVKKVLLIYDSDNAGVTAALRAIPLCRQAGLACKVVDLSPCKDPDEFIGAHGAEEFQKRLDNAKNSVYFDLDIKMRQFDLKDPDGESAFSKEVAMVIARMEDELERESYVKALSQRYSIPPQSLNREAMKLVAKNEGIELPDEMRTGMSSRRQEKEDALLTAQRYLLTALVDDPRIFPKVSDYVSPNDFEEGIVRDVAGVLFGQLKSGQANPAAIVDMYYESYDRDTVSRLFSSKYSGTMEGVDYENFISDLIVKIVGNRAASENTGDESEESDPIAGARLKADKRNDLKNLHIKL